MNAIASAISKAGGSTKLARALGLTRQAVEQWKGRVVPPEHVLAIEKLTGVTRYELRPDITTLIKHNTAHHTPHHTKADNM